MDTSRTTEAIDQDRHRLLGTATISFAVVGAASLVPARPIAAPAGDAIRPFRIDVPEETLINLRRRLVATRRWSPCLSLITPLSGPKEMA